MKPEAGLAARELLLSVSQGVLSTQSKEMPGYPFGSVVPYCLNAAGEPVFLISDIAQHTKNVKADARCSLIVVAGGADVQAEARLTLVGDCVPVPADEVEAVAARYGSFFPESKDYHKTHDFSFFVLKTKRCRFIGGFGSIHWLEPEAVLLANPFPGERELGMVGHMNADHADAILHYCAQYNLAVPEGVQPVMTGIDAEGINLRIGKRHARIAFEVPVSTPLAARETLVAMARAGRADAPAH
ncbi:MAG: HugZ family protein [Moraxellaceae bacterium]